MSRLRANLLLLLAAVLWGIGNIAHKTILDHLDAISVVGLTCLIGGLLTLPFIRAEITAYPGPGWSRSVVRVSALFALGVVLQQIAFVSASVTNASFLISTTTVLTPLFAWFMVRERPGPGVIVATGMTLTGSFLLSGGLSGTAGIGDAIALLAAAAFALWTVELGRHVKSFRRPFTTATAQFLGTALLVLPLSLARGDIHLPAVVAAWPELLMLGVFSTAVAFCLQTHAQRYTTANHAAVIVSSECVFAAIAAAAWLGERLPPQGVAGASIVLAGVLLVATKSGRSAHAAIKVP